MVACQAVDTALKAKCKTTWAAPKHSFCGTTILKICTTLWSSGTLIPFKLICFLFEFGEKFLGGFGVLEKFLGLSRCLSPGR